MASKKLNNWRLDDCDIYVTLETINDGSIKFPYLFKSTYYDSPYFTVNVKMTYLGKTFSYTSPDGYLDGATVSFVNNDCSPGLLNV